MRECSGAVIKNKEEIFVTSKPTGARRAKEEPSSLNHWAGDAHVPVFSLGTGSRA